MKMQEAINDALELLYGSMEEKHAGINKILALCRDTGIDALIDHHQLVSALARLFSEDNIPPELSFGIGKLFLVFCMDDRFHDVLSKYRVGALALGAIELEVKRAYHRVNDSISSSSFELASSAPPYSFTKKQELMVMVCCGILSNIADDFWALRKMIKKSLTRTLGHCLELRTLEALNAVLALLLKASIFEESADEISREKYVVEKLVGLLRELSEDTKASGIRDKVVRILFNLSFHEGCFRIMSSIGTISTIISLFETKPTVIKLTYQMSCNKENRNILTEAGIATKLSDLLKGLNHHTPEHSLAGLLVNMSSHPLCAEEFINNRAVDTILDRVQEIDDEYTQLILLKILRNLSRWSHNLQCNIDTAVVLGNVCSLDGSVKQVKNYFFVDSSKQKMLQPKYWEHHFWDTHVEEILHSALVYKNDDQLVEWIRILSNLTKDDMPAGLQWHDLIYDNSSRILRLCHNILDSSDECLKIEVITWLGELCTNHECSAWIASSNLVEAIHEELRCSSHEPEGKKKMLQILLTYQRFMMYEETRFHVIGGHGKFFLTHFNSSFSIRYESLGFSQYLKGVIEAMLNCLNERHELKIAAEE